LPKLDDAPSFFKAKEKNVKEEKQEGGEEFLK